MSSVDPAINHAASTHRVCHVGERTNVGRRIAFQHDQIRLQACDDLTMLRRYIEALGRIDCEGSQRVPPFESGACQKFVLLCWVRIGKVPYVCPKEDLSADLKIRPNCRDHVWGALEQRQRWDHAHVLLS